MADAVEEIKPLRGMVNKLEGKLEGILNRRGQYQKHLQYTVFGALVRLPDGGEGNWYYALPSADGDEELIQEETAVIPRETALERLAMGMVNYAVATQSTGKTPGGHCSIRLSFVPPYERGTNSFGLQVTTFPLDRSDQVYVHNLVHRLYQQARQPEESPVSVREQRS